MEQVAILELDEKYLKMLMVEYSEDGYTKIIDEYEEPLQIYKDIEIDKIIKPVRAKESIETAQYFKKIMDANKIRNSYAFLNQTLNNAINKMSFYEEMRSSTNFNWCFLNEMDTISAIHNLNFFTMNNKKSIVINIEDNKVNLIKYNRQSITDSILIPFGPATIVSEFNHKMTPSEKIDNLSRMIKLNLNVDEFFTNIEDFGIFGSGEYFTSLSRICKISTRSPIYNEHNFEIDKVNFELGFGKVSNMEFDSSKKFKNISDKPADLVVAGWTIIKSIMEKYAVKKIGVNSLPLIYGYMYQKICPLDVGSRINDILMHSLQNINYFFEDRCKGNKVFEIANEMFENLKSMHRFGKDEQKILKIASMLALSGKIISERNYERSCFGIIMNANIYGATRKEILMSAFVASIPNIDSFDFSKWARYKSILTESDFDTVKKLSVFVYLARKINKLKFCDHTVCDILGDNVIINIVFGENNDSCKLKELNSSNGEFMKAFNKGLQIL